MVEKIFKASNIIEPYHINTLSLLHAVFRHLVLNTAHVLIAGLETTLNVSILVDFENNVKMGTSSLDEHMIYELFKEVVHKYSCCYH